MVQGLGIRGTARVFEVAPNMVLQWLVEAAEHLQALSRHFLHAMHGNQVQLDELFALLSAVKDREVNEAEAITRLEHTPQWVLSAVGFLRAVMTLRGYPETLLGKKVDLFDS